MSNTKDLLGALLRQGGYVLKMVEAYFDESGSHEDSSFLCVAGYLFEKEDCIRFHEEWAEMLKAYGISYLRMSDCAHGNGECKALDLTQRIELGRQAIGLIKQYAVRGFAVSIDTRYQNLIPSHNLFKAPYSFACWQALIGVRKWADEVSYKGNIAYFFESGHSSRGEANALMSNIFSDAALNASYRYSAHTFGDKKHYYGLHAADVLAWHWYTHCNRVKRGEIKPRADFSSLMEVSHVVIHYGQQELLRLSQAA